MKRSVESEVLGTPLLIMAEQESFRTTLCLLTLVLSFLCLQLDSLLEKLMAKR